jgi:hypothetical protein
MPSLAHQRILVAAEGLLLVLFLLVPNPAQSVQENWVDQIAQRVRAEYNLAGGEPVNAGYQRYLAQLQSVRQVLERGHVYGVQTEMSRLVRMVATKEGGLSDSSAQSLLFYISEVTPGEYLDETTKTHLRLIQEMVTFKNGAVEEVPVDSPYASTVTPQTAPWEVWQFGWMRQGPFHPILTLGAGVLILVVIGMIVLLFVGLGGTSTNGQSGIHAKHQTAQGLEKKTPSAGSSRSAA